MKKAKIILAAVAILAVVGGALAFRASRFPPSVWSTVGTTLTTTQVGGQTYSTTIPNCVLLNLATTNVGIATTIYSTSTNTFTTVFTRLGGQQVTTTYRACIPTTLITTPVD